MPMTVLTLARSCNGKRLPAGLVVPIMYFPPLLRTSVLKIKSQKNIELIIFLAH
jgi:hypothetical protein